MASLTLLHTSTFHIVEETVHLNHIVPLVVCQRRADLLEENILPENPIERRSELEDNSDSSKDNSDSSKNLSSLSRQEKIKKAKIKKAMVKDIDQDLKMIKKREILKVSQSSSSSGDSKSNRRKKAYELLRPKGKFDSWQQGMKRMQTTQCSEFPIGPKVNVKAVVDNKENDDNWYLNPDEDDYELRMKYWEETGNLLLH